MVQCHFTYSFFTSLSATMEFPRLAVLALLLCLALAHATSLRSAEDYWRSIWPHTPMPENLYYLLESGVNLGEIEDTQYPYTSFFEDDLHAGKQMNIKFKSPYPSQPLSVGSEKRNTMKKNSDKPTFTQPYGAFSWGRNTMEKDPEKPTFTQPYGALSWGRNTMEKNPEKPTFTQPYGAFSWGRNTMEKDPEKPTFTQPYGVFSWGRNIKEKDPEKPIFSQPYGVSLWRRNTMEKDPEKPTFTQPYGAFSWGRNTMEKDLEKSTFTQPYGVFAWGGNAKEKNPEKPTLTQPYGVMRWGRNTIDKGTKILTMEEICNGEKFVGEKDKICAKSIESLLEFVISKLGKDTKALTSSFVPHQTQYTILEGVQRVSREGVMCHKLNFEEPVLYCHQVNATIAYTVPMEAADGTRTTVVAVCHHDTRGLNPDMLFHELKVMPGTVPICHFMGTGAIAWVPRNNKASY